LTLFFGGCGVGIHNVITKIYQMSVIKLISRKKNVMKYIYIINDDIDTILSKYERPSKHILYPEPFSDRDNSATSTEESDEEVCGNQGTD
jgi:hypothetical protein